MGLYADDTLTINRLTNRNLKRKNELKKKRLIAEVGRNTVRRYKKLPSPVNQEKAKVRAAKFKKRVDICNIIQTAVQTTDAQLKQLAELARGY